VCEGYSLSGSIHKDDACADIGVDISDGGKGIIRWSDPKPGWRGQQSLRSGAQREAQNVECVRVR